MPLVAASTTRINANGCLGAVASNIASDTLIMSKMASSAQRLMPGFILIYRKVEFRLAQRKSAREWLYLRMAQTEELGGNRAVAGWENHLRVGQRARDVLPSGWVTEASGIGLKEPTDVV